MQGRQHARAIGTALTMLVFSTTTWAQSMVIDYGYDPSGRLRTVSAGPAGAPTYAVTYARDGRGSRAATTVVLAGTASDIDNDGIDDNWELQFQLNPFEPADAGADSDGDGLTNFAEFNTGTHPALVDTDGDGVDDGVDLNPLFGPEILVPVTQWLLSDSVCIRTHETNYRKLCSHLTDTNHTHTNAPPAHSH